MFSLPKSVIMNACAQWVMGYSAAATNAAPATASGAELEYQSEGYQDGRDPHVVLADPKRTTTFVKGSDRIELLRLFRVVMARCDERLSLGQRIQEVQQAAQRVIDGERPRAVRPELDQLFPLDETTSPGA